MPKKEKPIIENIDIQRIAKNLRESGLTYDGTHSPLSVDAAERKLAEKGLAYKDKRVLEASIQHVNNELDESRKKQRKNQKKTTERKLTSIKANPEKNERDTRFLIQMHLNELGMLKDRHTRYKDQILELNSKKTLSEGEQILIKDLLEKMRATEKEMHHAENLARIEKSNLLGFDKLANKTKESLTLDIYGQHEQTIAVNKESLDDTSDKLSFTTKTGEQRTATKLNKEGKQVSLAQKSEARLNFEKQLKEVGAVQAQYLEAYKNHFAGLSSKKLRQNAILESLGLRKADHARALKQERTVYEKAKSSLTENLKRDLIEERGFAMDQAERVAKKYIEKVLTIENIKQEENKVATLRTELVDTRLADEAKQKTEAYETAKGLKKFGMWIDKNKLRIGGKVVSGSIAIASGLGAGAWALRAVAGMIGGRLGTKAGKFLGEKLGKKLFNSDDGSKQVEKITNKYLEGRISITEYQKKLEALGLNANKVTALLSIAGGAGGALGGTALEGFGYTHLQPMVADVQKNIQESIDGVHKLQGLTREYEATDVDSVKTSTENIGQQQPTLWERMNPKRWFGNDDATLFGDKDTSTDDTSAIVLEDKTANPTPTGETTQMGDGGKTAPTDTEPVVATAVKGDGYIKLAQHMQEKLRAQYPDIDTAPQPVQDFLNKTPEQFSIEEKMLVYTDGKASSGIVHPGYKLTLDPDTGRIEILDKDGNVVSVLEDGNTATDEVFTGKMIEDAPAPSDSVQKVSIDRGMSATWNNGTPEPGETPVSTDRGTEVPIETSTTTTLGTNSQEQSVLSSPTSTPDTNNVTPSAKVDPSSTFDTGPALKVDTTGYDPDVVSIAKMYAVNLSETAQSNFLQEYDTAVKNIFSISTEGKYLDNAYESPSLWDTYKNQSFNEIIGSLENKLVMSKFERGLYNYLSTGSTTKLQVLDIIRKQAPNIKLADVIAVVERNS